MRQPVDLKLDLAGRQIRIDSFRRTGHDLAFRLQHELVPDLADRLSGILGTLRVDDELQLARVVAQVDEDEAAVIAARVGPTGDGHAVADLVLPNLPAIEVAPAHAVSVATTSSRETACSSRPSRLIVVPLARTITTVPAPLLPAWVICPLKDRPA